MSWNVNVMGDTPTRVLTTLRSQILTQADIIPHGFYAMIERWVYSLAPVPNGGAIHVKGFGYSDASMAGATLEVTLSVPEGSHEVPPEGGEPSKAEQVEQKMRAEGVIY